MNLALPYRGDNRIGNNLYPVHFILREGGDETDDRDFTSAGRSSVVLASNPAGTFAAALSLES